MLLPESIIWCLDEDGIGGVKIYCEDAIKKEVQTFVEDTFSEKWFDLLDQVEEEEGDCLEKEEDINPLTSIADSADGLFMSLDNLAIHYQETDFVSNLSGDQALESTLKELKEKYPNISYEGYVGYYYSTVKSGEVVQYTLSSDNGKSDDENKTYDFVGKMLAFATGEDDFWEAMEEQLIDAEEEGFVEVLECFIAYSDWLENEVFDKLLVIAEDIDEDIQQILEEKLEEWKAEK